MFAGHEHKNIFQYLFDDKEYVNTVLMNSSIVPLKHESTFRVYTLNEDLVLENWQQYKMDLEKSYNKDKIV